MGGNVGMVICGNSGAESSGMFNEGDCSCGTESVGTLKVGTESVGTLKVGTESCGTARVGEVWAGVVVSGSVVESSAELVESDGSVGTLSTGTESVGTLKVGTESCGTARVGATEGVVSMVASSANAGAANEKAATRPRPAEMAVCPTRNKAERLFTNIPPGNAAWAAIDVPDHYWGESRPGKDELVAGWQALREIEGFWINVITHSHRT
jgi:hypothetical protein